MNKIWNFTKDFIIDCVVVDTEVVPVNDDNFKLRLPDELKLVEGVTCKMIIPVKYTGYYIPGVMSGRPENSYPTDSDDSRELAGPCYVKFDSFSFYLSQEHSDGMFELYEKQIKLLPVEE